MPCGVIRHRASGDSVPNAVDVRICFLFENLAAGVGDGDVAGCLAETGVGDCSWRWVTVSTQRLETRE